MGVIEHPALTPQWLTPLQAAEYLVHVDGCARGLLVIEVQSKGEKMTGEKEFAYAGTDRLIAALRARREEPQEEPNAYVFGMPEGRRQKDFHRSWQRLLKVAGLEYGA